MNDPKTQEVVRRVREAITAMIRAHDEGAAPDEYVAMVTALLADADKDEDLAALVPGAFATVILTVLVDYANRVGLPAGQVWRDLADRITLAEIEIAEEGERA